MGWRPESWKNPWGKVDDTSPSKYINDLLLTCYEAGADAMLNELWAMAKESPTGTFTIDTNIITIQRIEEGIL